MLYYLFSYLHSWLFQYSRPVVYVVISSWLGLLFPSLYGTLQPSFFHSVFNLIYIFPRFEVSTDCMMSGLLNNNSVVPRTGQLQIDSSGHLCAGTKGKPVSGSNCMFTLVWMIHETAEFFYKNIKFLGKARGCATSAENEAVCEKINKIHYFSLHGTCINMLKLTI